MKILISAYACRPGLGSEPGVGWNWAVQAARFHDVWVITRADNRSAIETELERRPIPRLHMEYHDLPPWARLALKAWGRGGVPGYLRLYLWQWTAIDTAKALDSVHRFDIAHHITFASIRNWSFLARLSIPFIWGPVGGGEQTPPELLSGLPLNYRLIEMIRNLSNSLIRFDPLVRHTTKRAMLTLATTPDTAEKIPHNSSHPILIHQNIGLDKAEMPSRTVRSYRSNWRLLYVGRLIYWKGVDMALEALTLLSSSYPDITLTLIGDGPDRSRLKSLAATQGIIGRVEFLDAIPRAELLNLISEYDAAIFPSTHDSGRTAILEAMAAELPVICLNTGGPAMIVTDECGFKVSGNTRQGVIRAMADAIGRLRDDEQLRTTMGKAGHRRVIEHYLWDWKGELINDLYEKVVSGNLHESQVMQSQELVG